MMLSLAREIKKGEQSALCMGKGSGGKSGQGKGGEKQGDQAAGARMAIPGVKIVLRMILVPETNPTHEGATGRTIHSAAERTQTRGIAGMKRTIDGPEAEVPIRRARRGARIRVNRPTIQAPCPITPCSRSASDLGRLGVVLKWYTH